MAVIAVALESDSDSEAPSWTFAQGPIITVSYKTPSTTLYAAFVDLTATFDSIDT